MLGETTLQTWDATMETNTTTSSIALQFQDLFGQDVLYEENSNNSPFYDEMTFDQAPMNQNYEGSLPKRRRSNSCSSSSSSFYSSEEDDGDSFSALHSYRSDDEQVPTPAQRRQMEDLILDKISNQLDPEKLPGILTIISSKEQENDEEEEVEIDLAQLNIDQLTRILSYVDACLQEKNGGPKVKPFDYAVKRNNKSNRRQRRQQQRQAGSILDQGHVVTNGFIYPSLGPMASIIESDDDSYMIKKKKRTKKSKHKNNKQKNQQRQKEKTATKQSKKKSAIHKRRLLEEMLHPQNIDDDDDEKETEGGNGIIIFGNEEMDFAVTQNETIAHQQQRRRDSIVIVQPQKEEQYDVDDDDELIDIMM